MRRIYSLTIPCAALVFACKGDPAVYDDDSGMLDDTGSTGDDETDDGTDDGIPESCGDGVHDAGEECDDGELNAAQASCTPECKLNTCGDGYAHIEAEECDDGNDVDADGCEADCTLPACGNGIIDPGEICYDEPTVLDTQSEWWSLEVGDIDGDGSADLAVADRTNDAVGVLIGAGNGTFQNGDVLAGQEATRVVGLGDMDGDDDLDLLAVSGNTTCSMLPCDPIPGRLSLWHNDGNGGFGAASVVLAGDTPLDIETADFDGDGRRDVLIGDVTGKAVHFVRGLPDAPFLADPVSTDTTASAGGTAIGDLDADDELDVIAVGGPSLMVLHGNGDGTFTETDVLEVGTGLMDPWIVDLDDDGHLDVITIDGQATVAHVFLNDGTGEFTPRTETWAGWGPRSLVVDDLSQDGTLDFAAVNWQQNVVTPSLGLGDGTFEDLPAIEPWGSPNEIVSADFNEDGAMDLAITRATKMSVTVFLADP